MREILFRGKRIDNGEWVEGYLRRTTLFNASEAPPHWRMAFIIEPPFEEPFTCEWAEVDPDTVGQYTGLNDKNGKRIFEGDICQIKNHHLIGDLPFVIEWEDFAYNGWTWRDLDEIGAVDSFTKGAAKVCEVIGNIHDNRLEDFAVR